MNYRHAYHAGNFADVLKHAVLALIIEHLKLKPAPFRVIDTHAGAGEYDLQGIEAEKTGEWRDGLARMLAAKPDAAAAELLKPYLDAVRDGLETPRFYPGSPLLARRLMRPQDRLIVNELHPEDAAALTRLFKRDAQVKVTTLDGWTALKAFLPPKERRGVVLVDPPFEEAGELERLTAGLKEAAKRFATGTVVLWYPVKAAWPVAQFERAITELCLPKTLAVRLMVRDGTVADRLNGSGLIILNPPHSLTASLQILLPFLAATLALDRAGNWNVCWLTGEGKAASMAGANDAGEN